MMKKLLQSLFVVVLAATALVAQAENYGINVGGIEVSSSNYSNVTGGNISGSVSYSPSTKTLTISSATISRTTSDDFAVHNRDCNGLTIVFKGNCTLSSTKAHSLKLDKSTTINVQSGAQVNVTSGTGRALFLKSIELTIKGSGNIDFRTTASGDACIKGGDATVVNIDGAHITAKSYNNYALSTLMINFHSGTDLRLYNNGTKQLVENCAMASLVSPSLGKPAILEPYGAYTTSSRGTIYTSGGSSVTYSDIYISDNYVVIIKDPYFPDAYLRQNLMNKYFIMGYITATDVANTKTVDLHSCNISDLTGMSYLSEVTSFNCSSNKITSLSPISGWKKLVTLNCSNNQIASLIPIYDALESTVQTFDCSSNKITNPTIEQSSSIKTINFSNNPNLTEVKCTYNTSLTSLNVSGCSALQKLICYNNKLTSLGTVPTSVQYIDCAHNQLSGVLNLTNRSALTYLDCHDNTGLTEVNCYGSALTKLWVTNNSSMASLQCYSNQLTALDVSGCSALSYLHVANNKLTSLSLVLSSRLKDLLCYNNQLTSISNIPSTIEQIYAYNNKFTSLTITSRPNLKYLDVKNNTLLTSLNCSSNALTSLNISGCCALNSLNCSMNALTSLNSSSCSALTSLNCYGNALTSLNVSGCSALTTLKCAANKLTSLSNLPSSLLTLECWNNQLTSLAFESTPSSLQYLDCSDNQLTRLPYISTDMQTLNCSNNKLDDRIYIHHLDYWDGTQQRVVPCKLKSLNCSDNPDLPRIDILDAPEFTNLTMNNCSSLQSLIIQTSGLASLGLGSCPNLTSLTITYSKITSLNLAPCTKLENLDCWGNPLTSISNIPSSIQTIWANDNKLTSLSIANKPNLSFLRVENNQLSSLSVNGCNNLTTIYCEGNQIKGSGMSTLVNSLRTLPAETLGTFHVISDKCDPDNEITDEQVNIARDKNWIPQRYDADERAWVEIVVAAPSIRGDIDGNSIVDVNDLSLLIDVVLGYKSVNDPDIKGNCDLDGQYGVDVSDITILIDIVLGN